MERSKKAIVGLVLTSLLAFSVVPYFNVRAQTCDPAALVPVSYGQRGAAVRNAQACLIEAGYDIPAGVTGYYGSQTRNAVKEFYADWYGTWAGNSLGPKGVAELKSRLAAAPSQPTQPTAGGVSQNQLQQVLTLLSQGKTNEALALLLTILGSQQQQTTIPTTPTGEISVSLASDNPSAGTLIASQTGATLLKFVVNNGTQNAVTITSVKVKRGGVSSDSTLSNVYLYANDQRVSDPASLSQSYANFTGLNVQVAPNSSVTFAVVADVAAGTSGQTINFSIQSAADIGGATVSGNFPISGNTFTIASTPSDFAYVSVSNVQPNTTGSVTPGTNAYSVFRATVQVNNRDVLLKSLRLRMIGSIAQNDLQNFGLYVDGTQVATASLGSDNYVVFTPSTPYTLRAGSRNLDVRADIVGGSTRQFSFSLRYPSDLSVVDSQYGVGVQVSGTPASTAQITVSQGSLTVQRLPLTSSYVVKDSRTSLAKFEFRAYGEPVKVESLTVAASYSGSGTGNILRNGAIYVNGVQVGATQHLGAPGSPTTFNNLNFVVNPGTPATVEIYADVAHPTSSTLPTIGTSDLKITLKQGSSNAQATQSLTIINVPGADTDGDTLSVVTGQATLLANASYGNQTFVRGKTGAKIASYVVVANQYEGLTINSFKVNLSTTSVYQNLRLSVNPSDVRGTPASQNNFSLSLQVPAGGQQVIDVLADILSSASTGTVTSSAEVSYNTASGITGSSSANGQQVTIANAGTLTPSLAPDTPLSKYLVTNSTGAEFLKIKVRASAEEDIQITDIRVLATTTVPGFHQNIDVDGIKRYTWDTAGTNTSTVLFSGLNIVVPANSERVISIKTDLAPWTAVSATTGVTTTLGVTEIKYKGVDSGLTRTNTSTLAGNTMTIYRTKLDASMQATGIKGPSAQHDVAILKLYTRSNETSYTTSKLTSVKLTFRGSSLTPVATFTVSLVEGNNVLVSTTTASSSGVHTATLDILSPNQETGAQRDLTIRINSAGFDASAGKYFTVAVEDPRDLQWNDDLASDTGLDTTSSPLSGLTVTVNY
jgi:hypothetical protein